jgi:putative ABC transport system permease protein
MKLVRTLVLRPLRRDPLRTALSVLSIALGVAVVVAIDLSGDAAAGSFHSSLETLVGTTDLEILANGGVDERWMGRLAALKVDARFSPAIEAQAVIRGAGSVPLYGLDLIAGAQEGRSGKPVDPDKAIVVSRALADRFALRPGAALEAVVGGKARAFEVAEIAEAKNAEFVVLDIALAQQMLGRYGTLDRIDVKAAPGTDFAAVERAVRQALPPGYLVEKPGSRSEENQRMLRAFRWNLRVLSYISLVVSVVRRRGEIGVLRAIGTSRAAIFALFLGEALMLGLAGAALGVGLGRALASGIVGLISATVNALYTTSRPAPVELTWAEAAVGALAGAAVAFFAAFAPAREAMNVAPTEAMGRGAHEHHARLHWRRDLLFAGLLAALATVCGLAPPIDGKPVAGYVAALLSIGAAALAAPALVLGIDRLTRPLARRWFGAQGMLAARSLSASLSRTSVMVAALGTAIAMMASVGIMVGSFRATVELWLNQQLRADLYVRPAGASGSGRFPALPSEVPAAMRAVPGVEAVDVFHGLEFRYGGDRAILGAGEMEIVRRYGRLRFLAGQDRDAILHSLPGRDRAIVSEPFANRHGVRAGDRITIPIGTQQVMLDVAGVYYEYSSSQGYVVLDRSTLQRYLPGQPPTNAAAYLAKGADLEAVRRDMQQRLGSFPVVVAANQDLRRAALEIFDRTFAITWALEAVAIVVAMLGAANSLVALVLDRRRELGLLRYLGASAKQVRGMILLEAGFLGVLASVLGLALGSALSVLLIYVVNKQSFGWTIQFHPPSELLGGALLLVWCATVLAGLYPAGMAARLDPIDVIHEE